MVQHGSGLTGTGNRVMASIRRSRVFYFVLGLLVCASMSPLPAYSQSGKPSSLDERLQLCSSCHGGDGNSVIPENPKLAGLVAGYITKQLSDFKHGLRKNPTMSTMAATISEEEINALASYYSKKKRSPGAATDARLAARGKAIYDDGIVGSAVPACSACHNDDGSGTAKFPRLAGQHSAYVVQQMMSFKSGYRNNDSREVMRAVAKRMSEEEIRAVAEYIVTLTGGE